MNSRWRKALYGLVAVLAAGAGLYFAYRAVLPAAPSADSVARLMALELPDTDGKNHALAQWRGQTLVVNFWATWCPPCREEMPAFSRLAEKHAGNGVQFVGIAIDSAAEVQKFRREVQVAYPLLIGTMDTIQVAGALGNSALGLPFTVIVGRDGRVIKSRLGTLSETELDAILQGSPSGI